MNFKAYQKLLIRRLNNFFPFLEYKRRIRLVRLFVNGAIKKMPKGTSLTFVGVSAAGPSGKSVPIGGLSFKLI
jgi:hypothetical protein